MRKHLIALVLGLLVVPLAAVAAEPRTGKRGDELEDRIPAVSGSLFLKDGRHEFAPVFDMSLADAFRQKYMGGLTYTYHVTEHWAATARVAYTLGTTTSPAVQVCETAATCRSPNDAELDALPGNLRLVSGVMAEFSPIYGKINFIAEKVLHFDLYATAGVGLASYGLVLADGDRSGMSPSLMLGVGQRYFVNEWIAVKLELLDMIWFQPTAKADTQPNNQLMFTLGVSFFFPTSFSYDRQG